MLVLCNYHLYLLIKDSAEQETTSEPTISKAIEAEAHAQHVQSMRQRIETLQQQKKKAELTKEERNEINKKAI